METSDPEPGQTEPAEAACGGCRWSSGWGWLEAGAQIAALCGLSRTARSRGRRLLALDQPVRPHWLLLLVYLAQQGLVARVAALPWRF